MGTWLWAGRRESNEQSKKRKRWKTAKELRFHSWTERRCRADCCSIHNNDYETNTTFLFHSIPFCALRACVCVCLFVDSIPVCPKCSKWCFVLLYISEQPQRSERRTFSFAPSLCYSSISNLIRITFGNIISSETFLHSVPRIKCIAWPMNRERERLFLFIFHCIFLSLWIETEWLSANGSHYVPWILLIQRYSCYSVSAYELHSLAS